MRRIGLVLVCALSVLALGSIVPALAQEPTPDLPAAYTIVAKINATLTALAVTPALGETPTLTATAPMTTTPGTPDFGATESAIVTHVLATLTASAPTPTAWPTATATPTREWDVRCEGRPPGMICVWLHNYRGGNDAFTFNIDNKAYPLLPGGDVVIFLPPGTYRWTASMYKQPGLRGEWTLTEDQPMQRFYIY